MPLQGMLLLPEMTQWLSGEGFTISVWVFLALVGWAFIAGLISAIAGSGGLLILPVLLIAGLPPLLALGTNKFQSVFGTFSSALHFWRAGKLNLLQLRQSMAYALLGAVIGALLVQQFSNQFLKQFLPVVMVLLAVYVALSPRLSSRVGQDNSEPRWSQGRFDRIIGGGVGFYGGFLGPGMASFYTLAFVGLRDVDLQQATAASKPLVLVVNTTALLVFMASGLVFWPLALAMAFAQFLGARIGAGLVLSKGAALIQPVLLVMLVVMAFKLLFFP